MHRALLVVLVSAVAASAETVEIRSSMDGAQQPAVVIRPPAGAAEAVPLVVHLHSWSARFDTSNNFDEVQAEVTRRGWAMISPDFRGVNDHPEACGSELAVQDVLDAVEWMKANARIDERRVYVVGSSGGGYMTLMMAGRAPHVWAAASAWVPISDLVEWHAFSKAKDARYWKMLEGCFGNPPSHGHALQQYRRRSPVHFLNLASGLPLDIQTGIHDGHTGSVPVSHTLRAFNRLAAPADRIADADIESITRDEKIPAHLAVRADTETGRKKAVLLRRSSGSARVTIFEGGHEADFPAAIRWLEKHVKPQARIEQVLQSGQVLQRDAAGRAAVPAPRAVGGRLEARAAGGVWSRTMPVLATGGPYTVEFRVVDATGRAAAVERRTGILVGDLYLLAGQSNMVGRAPLVDPAPEHPLVHMLNGEDVWTPARDPVHEALPRDGRVVGIGLGLPFAKEMLRRTGVPVGLIPCAIGGTSLEQWSPARSKIEFRRSLYGNLMARARLAGGRFRAILWYQGENEAGSAETASTYGERFQQLVAAMRSDLGDARLPFYYAQIARVVTGHAAAWERVREAQRLSEKAVAPGGMVSGIDATLTDSIHLDRASLETLGRRFATRILDGPGPELVSAAWDGPGLLRLKFTRRLRADGSRIFGFDLGAPAVFHARQDASSGDILLEVTPPPAGAGPLELYYGRGVNPVCNLTDARGMALPAFGPVRLDPPPRP